MRRGTTPKHTFTLPFDTDTLSKVRIIYAQDEIPVLIRDDATLDGNTVEVKLTQEETLKFNEQKGVEIQLRAITADGEDAIASDIMRVSVKRLLENEVFA